MLMCDLLYLAVSFFARAYYLSACLAAAGSVMSPSPGITSRDLTSRGLPGCMIFPQAGYLAGQSQPALGCREGEEA